MKDMRGVELSIGDIVVYGKSSRYHLINIGTVTGLTEDYIEILGRNNIKVGNLPKSHSGRVIVLPDNYLEDCE